MAEPKQLGRPTKYKEEYNEQAYKLCLLGHTDEELASFFEVDASTIHRWKHDYPDFCESIKKGKVIADAEVSSSLYNRATGMIIKTQQAMKVKNVTFSEGKKESETENIEIAELENEIPPDPTSMIFWLKNRQPDKWREKREVVEVEADNDITINVRRVGKKDAD